MGELAESIAAWLRGIGIDVVVEALGEDTFLPGVMVREGTIVVRARGGSVTVRSVTRDGVRSLVLSVT